MKFSDMFVCMLLQELYLKKIFKSLNCTTAVLAKPEAGSLKFLILERTLLKIPLNVKKKLCSFRFSS